MSRIMYGMKDIAYYAIMAALAVILIVGAAALWVEWSYLQRALGV